MPSSRGAFVGALCARVKSAAESSRKTGFAGVYVCVYVCVCVFVHPSADHAADRDSRVGRAIFLLSRMAAIKAQREIPFEKCNGLSEEAGYGRDERG